MTDEQRGIQYADGGNGAYDKVCYPDPKRIAAIHAEWEQHPDGPPERACV